MTIERIAAAIRDVPDFPHAGIIYKDITPLLKNPELFAETIKLMSEVCRKQKPDYIAAIESRGFIFGTALSMVLGCGFIPVRKKGKLPYRTLEESYALEYGNATIEIHEDALTPGDRVVLIDDVLATGGTAGAAAKLLSKLGAEIVGINFLLELSFLNGRKVLGEYEVNSLLQT